MKNPRDLTDKIQKTLSRKEKTASPPHSYAKVPALKVSSQVPAPLPTQKKDLSNTSPVSNAWNAEVTQTIACSCHMESDSVPGAHLIPERVHRWKIKNHSSIIRKMQDHIRPKATELPEKISVFTTEKDQETKNDNRKQDELWRDMMKNQEERHFHLGRITNFFT